MLARCEPAVSMILAGAIVFAAFIMFTYETYGPLNLYHRNRLTGATCPTTDTC